MPTDTPTVDAGDYIVIPCHNKADADGLVKRHKIRWHQYYQTHNETYDQVLVQNITKNTEVPMYIQAQWYRIYDDEHSELPKEHLCHVAELTDNGYKLHVDYRVQYGQENLAGKNRFLVYHDPDRIPYQNRFVPTPVPEEGLGVLLPIITSLAPPQLLKLFGKIQPLLPAILDRFGSSGGGGKPNFGFVLEDIRNLVGNGLHTFRYSGTPTGSQ